MKKLLLLFLVLTGMVSTVSAKTATVYVKASSAPNIHIWNTGDGGTTTEWGDNGDKLPLMETTNLYGVTVYKCLVTYNSDTFSCLFKKGKNGNQCADIKDIAGDVYFYWDEKNGSSVEGYDYSVSTVEVKGDINSWGTGETMILSEGVYSATVDLTSSISNQNIKFLVTNAEGDTGWLGWNTNSPTITDTGSLLSEGSDDNITVANGNKTYKTYNVSLTLSTPTSWSLTFAGNATRGSQTYNLTVNNEAGWGAVKVYTFGPDLYQSGIWASADDMTYTTGSTWTYSKTFYEPYPEKVIFKDAGSNQTADLQLINNHTYTNQAVEKLYVIGSIPEFGNWSESTNAAMTFVENGDQDYWTYTLEDIELSSNVEFKFMKKNYDEAVDKTYGLWPNDNKTITVSEAGKYTINITFLSHWKDWANNGIASGSATLTAVPTTVSAAGYATFVSPNALDFTSTAIKAYTASVNTTNGQVILSNINVVPANTPVVLYKEGGDTEDIPVTTSDAVVASNLVAGTGATVPTTDGAGNYNYILNNVSGIGFYKANDQIVAANRAYLHTTYNVEAPGARMIMVFADETTGITEYNVKTISNHYFDMQGRSVAQPTKGLYIVNGKKVIIK